MQKRILSLFWRAAKKYPWRLGIALINSIITSAVSAFAGPLVIAVILDSIQTGSITLEKSIPLIGVFLALQLYGQVIGWRITLFCVWTFETAAQNDLGKRVLEHLADQSLKFHNNRFGGSIVSQNAKLIGAFERFWDTMIFTVMPSLTSVVAATVILSFVLWQYALVLFILSLLFAAAVLIGSRYLADLNKREAQASSALTGRFADIITNVQAVKSDGNESLEVEGFTGYQRTWRKRSLASMSGFLKASTVYSAIIATLNTSALVVAIMAVENNLASVSTVYLCVTYTFTVARQLWELNSIIRNYNRVMGDAHDMADILEIEPAVKDVTNAKPFTVESGKISFDDITFQHADSSDNEHLFKDFSLEIQPSEKIGLVGHSGSGKTTLTKLLLRFMDVNDGAVSIDGRAINTIRQADLRRSIAYVPQEPLLFHRTLSENIAYGKPGASSEEVVAAAKKAHALEFIEKLPQGFDTLVGERGVKLSGGQRQRIAIARAILKDAPIIVLDEATSALDSESEKLIQTSLKELMKGRTTIVIAHRLSTVQKMDRIVVLEDGKIIEDGAHSDLLAKNGTYASLWKHQSGGFIEE